MKRFILFIVVLSMSLLFACGSAQSADNNEENQAQGDNQLTNEEENNKEKNSDEKSNSDQEANQNSNEETAILPDNKEEVDHPPFEYKLPSTLPFEVSEAEAQLLNNPEESTSRYSVTYFPKESGEAIEFEVFGEVSEDVELKNIETINGVEYGFEETEQSRLLRFQEGNKVYSLNASADPDTRELNITKEALIKVAESFVKVEK